MLSKKAFAAGITALASIWQRLSIVVEDKNVFEFWHNALSDLEDEQFVQAIKKIISSFKEQPTIADIREIAIEFANPSLTPEEAWAIVYNDVRSRGYYREPLYDDWKLEAAKNAIGWHHLCDMTADTVAATRAQFMKIYAALQGRERNALTAGDGPTKELVTVIANKLASRSPQPQLSPGKPKQLGGGKDDESGAVPQQAKALDRGS